MFQYVFNIQLEWDILFLGSIIYLVFCDKDYVIKQISVFFVSYLNRFISICIRPVVFRFSYELLPISLAISQCAITLLFPRAFSAALRFQLNRLKSLEMSNCTAGNELIELSRITGMHMDVCSVI